MAQDLTTTTSSLPATPTVSRRTVEARVEALHGALVPADDHPTRFCVSPSAAPTDLDRRQLAALGERLERELEPCRDAEAVEVVISRVLLGFEQGKPSDDQVRALNAEYVAGLKGLSLAGIQAAADRYRNATTFLPWEPAFRPKPGEFAREVREGETRERAKLVRLRRVLDAKVLAPPAPPSEADLVKMKAATDANLAILLGGMDMRTASAGPPPIPDDERQAAEARLAEMAAEVGAAEDIESEEAA